MIGNAALWIKSSGPQTSERQLSIYPPAKARRSRCVERPERGGGRAWRVGTRSGYGSTGGRGILCGAVAARSALRAGPCPLRIVVVGFLLTEALSSLPRFGGVRECRIPCLLDQGKRP